MERVQIKTFQRKAEERPVQCFTQEEAETFLEVLENPLVYQYKPRQRVDRKGKIYFVEEYESSRAVQNQIKFFLYMAMFTGCRRGELIALRWSDIDFESSSVKITKSTCRTNGKMITKTTKTGATREIAVPELICKMARQWQIEQLRQQLCCHTFDFSEGRYSDCIRAAGACQCIHNTEYIQPCAQRIG